jgi:hypothetical protein
LRVFPLEDDLFPQTNMNFTKTPFKLLVRSLLLEIQNLQAIASHYADQLTSPAYFSV